jgi:hypothetical protein
MKLSNIANEIRLNYEVPTHEGSSFLPQSAYSKLFKNSRREMRQKAHQLQARRWRDLRHRLENDYV